VFNGSSSPSKEESGNQEAIKIKIDEEIIIKIVEHL